MDNRIEEARRTYAATVGRFTQEDAAAYFGVSVSTYQKWEQGQGRLNGSQLREIAKLYGVTVDYLLMIDRTPEPPRSLSADERRLVEVMRSVTAQGREQLMIAALGVAERYSKNNQAERSA